MPTSEGDNGLVGHSVVAAVLTTNFAVAMAMSMAMAMAMAMATAMAMAMAAACSLYLIACSL